MEKHSREIGKFFHKPLENFRPPILFTGSKGDEFLSELDVHYFEKTYSSMIEKIGHGELFIFEKGGHPAMLSNQSEFVRIGEIFLKK